jgi:hypothetical protein
MKMETVFGYLLFFILAMATQGSKCGGPSPVIPDAGSDCVKTREHILNLGCNPKGKWLEACESHQAKNTGMFDLHCINNAMGKEVLIKQCGVACVEDGGAP